MVRPRLLGQRATPHACPPRHARPSAPPARFQRGRQATRPSYVLSVTDEASSSTTTTTSSTTSSSSTSSQLPAPPAPASAWPPPPPSIPPPIAVDIEAAPSNGRRLYATTDIAAPAFVVWAALTDYDRLGDFVPGLAGNRCLARTAGGCTLLQVGQQSLALGLKFKARVVLDIQEHMSGLPASLWSGGGGGDGAGEPAPPPEGSGEVAAASPLELYPQPRSGLSPSTPTRDISFAQVEGDFVAFRGVWRLQELRGREGLPPEESGDEGGSSSSSLTGLPPPPPPPLGPRTRLSYALYVRPAPWLPVHLVAKRVGGDVAANLAAVRKHAEQKWRGG